MRTALPATLQPCGFSASIAAPNTRIRRGRARFDERHNDRLFVLFARHQGFAGEPMPTRLSRISIGLGELIVKHRPDRVAIEDVFYATNVKSALKLGQVRGVAMLARHLLDWKSRNILLCRLSRQWWIRRAEKHQVQQMVTRLLNLDQIPEPADAADALAIAICHLHTRRRENDRAGSNGGLPV